MLSIPWPGILKEMRRLMAFMVLDITDVLHSQCSYGSQEVAQYIMGALVFPYALCTFSVVCFLTHMLQLPTRFRWSWEQVINTKGAFMQLLYSAIAIRATIPMICYQHPQGDRSVMQMPSLVCGAPECEVKLGERGAGVRCDIGASDTC